MAEAVSLFWSFGSMYFSFLGDIAVFGVSVLCYILGAWLVSQILSMLIRTGRGVKIRFSHSIRENYNYYDGHHVNEHHYYNH